MELVTLFGLIVIHECGHVSAARYFGWRMTEIELLPFGGVAKTDEWGTVPAREELIVAVAGPAYNGIMIVFGAVCFLSGWWTAEWAQFFVTANLWLAGFNLLPVYPLDGGRILHAFLSYTFPYRTCITSSLFMSLTLSVAMLAGSLFPLLYDQPLMFNVGIIAAFLIVSNVIMWRQKNYQFMRFLMQRQIDEHLDEKPVIPLLAMPEDTVLATIKRWKKEAYNIIVVQDHSGNVIRVLSEQWLLNHFLRGSSPRGNLGDLLD